jgi:hypothetical protein
MDSFLILALIAAALLAGGYAAWNWWSSRIPSTAQIHGKPIATRAVGGMTVSLYGDLHNGQIQMLVRFTHKGLQIVEGLEFALDLEENSQEQRKLLKAVREFGTYITANRPFIPNYGDRYRHGETISTGFVESAINQVLSKRFVKRQQMRWTDRGAHLLLQVRTRVLNEDWRSTLSRWYPGMKETLRCEGGVAPGFSRSPAICYSTDGVSRQ